MSKKDKNSFLSIFDDNKKEPTNGHAYPSFFDPEDSYEMSDEMDHLILMHRDAHFGGDFQVMIDYYEKEGAGALPDIDLERILYLNDVEEKLGQDLAGLMLSGPEAEKIARARRAYEKLKEIYEDKENEVSPFPRLIADLILSEEEEPEKEIQAVVEQGAKILPELLLILKSDDAYDPLFPGYGYAPYFAILCLGKIRDERAIQPLFEILGKDFIFDEYVIVESLVTIGKSAKEFLLKLLKSRPITEDNLHAAFALTAFGNEPEVSLTAFQQLKDPEVLKKPILRLYLLFCCEALENTEHREEFITMSQDPDLPEDMKEEIKNISRSWK